MKFISLVDNFRSALGITAHAIGKSFHLPILGHFLIESDKNKIFVSTTNLELAITTTFSAKIESPGKITVPAKTLLEFLSQISDEKLEGESDGKKLRLVTEHYRASFQGFDPDEFPLIPKLSQQEPIRMPTAVLRAALSQVIPAASASEIRPELAGILFSYTPGKRVVLVATDSFRLAEKSIFEDTFHANLKEPLACLIPIKTCHEALRISQEKEGEVEIYVDPNQVEFRWDDTHLVSRLLEGEFPEYSSVIPKEFAAEGVVERRKVIEAIRATAAFSSKLNDVKVTADPGKGKFSFSAAEVSVGENEAIVESELKGKAAEVSFNYRYLVDGFENVPGEKAYLGLGSETSPAIIKGEKDASYFYIVMPIRA